MSQDRSNHVVITGGTGFIGKGLSQYLLTKGLTPIIIGRTHPTELLNIEFVQWDARKVGRWSQSLEGALAIVNLAGRTVDCVKTPDHCDEILRSRVESTRAIGFALKEVKNPPKVWVQMSTAHIYGDPPKLICTEDSEYGYGLAPFVAQAWEKAFQESIIPKMKQVVLRTSFVLGQKGGAMGTLKRITKFGLGGKVGNGKQGISWIHEEDLNELIYQSIVNDGFEGTYIASAPNPVSNKAFMKALRKSMKMPIGLPAPEFMVRIGAKYIFKTDPELALYGRYVKSQRLEKDGFEFKYPTLKEAFLNLYK